MEHETFKTKLHTIFESCDYKAQLKEDSHEEKVKFVHTCPDGSVYNIEVEPSEQEFYVYQDGKQIDLFNMNLVDADGGITKDKRQMIVKDWSDNHNSKQQTAQPEPSTAGADPETFKNQ